ncbi:MAG TPA: hypothetical protein VNA89_03875 [Gemmatimonadaceae bacterium]|nr:hypothetical protein [Gemmatimonadaceae bacterium]
MRSLRLAWLAAALASLAAAPSLAAQKGTKTPRIPPRPALGPDADTNSAGAYFGHGMSALRRRPHEAADAFYWASRIEPGWAQPYYARRIALLLTDKRRLLRMFEGRERSDNSPLLRLADSLQYFALLRDPFLHRGLDRVLFEEAFYEATGVVPFYGQLEPEMAAWLAHSRGEFGTAAPLYAKALKRRPKAYWLRGDRAQNFFHLAQYDSAVSEMGVLLDSLRGREEKTTVVFYESKAMYEYALGEIHLRQRDLAAAREAFGRSVTEDLSFYMAHARLAEVAFVQADTAAALAEYELAAQLNADDAALRQRYAMLLLYGNKHGEAAQEFQRAAKIAPEFAAPNFYLARMHEAYGDQQTALAYYRHFVALAARNAEGLPLARQKVDSLTAAGVVALELPQ